MMRNSVLVSVIVPIYNAEKVIRDCLDSIITQTYTNIEILLINDGSTDESGRICEKYALIDDRIKIIHTQNNGVSASRNIGIKKSNGKYLLFVDSDDFISDDYIEKLISKNKYEFVICRYDKFFYNNKSALVGNCVKKISKNLLKKYEYVYLCKIGLLNTPCCKLYSKEKIISKKILFDERLSLGEDLLFNLEYIKHIGNIYIIDEYLYHYRIHSNSTLSNKYIENMKEIQLTLLKSISKTFIVDHNYLKIFNKYRLNCIMIILDNELRNTKTGLIKKYYKIRKLLSEKEIHDKIIEYSVGCNRIKIFLLKNKFYFLLKIIIKIEKLFNFNNI